MNSISLPGTGLTVSEFCLGTAGFGSALSRNDSFVLLDLFEEFGGTFIDTARVYADWLPGGHGASETTIGTWMRTRQKRHHVILATKGGHPHLDRMDRPRLSRGDLSGDLDASLRALRCETIDLYFLHRDDPSLPVEEILDTLETLRTSGKIRYYAASNWSAGRLRAARIAAERMGTWGFVVNQPLWNLAVTDLSRSGDPTLVSMTPELFDFHMETNLAVTAYSAQANGLFSRIDHGTLDEMPAEKRAIYPSEPNLKRFQTIQTIASNHGWTVNQVVLGFLRSQPFPVIPIIGPRNPSQLKDSLLATGIRLSMAERIVLQEES